MEFEKEEAKEVIEAVGAWIYIFRKPITASDVEGIKEAMTAIKGIIEKACGEYWEGCCLAVGTRQSVTTSLKLEGEAWEDFCRETGFEYVDAEGKGKNEYGEPVGIERMREALETTEWEGGDGEGDIEEEFGFTDGGEGWEGLAGEEAEMSVELLGMKGAMHGETSEDEKENADEQVEEMGRMMNRLLAIKGMYISWFLPPFRGIDMECGRLMYMRLQIRLRQCRSRSGRSLLRRL